MKDTVLDHAEALAKALEPFSTYTPARVFESKARFALTETTEAGGGWFGAEDFRAARSALAAYRSRPAAEVVAWPNGCDTEVPAALRFLADYARPSGGEQRFNAAHLHQLASEIEAMVRRPLYATPALAGTEPAGEVVEDGWLDISSAPKTHGAMILSTNRHGAIDIICWNDATGGWDDGIYRDDDEPFFPKLWQPLPALRDQSEA